MNVLADAVAEQPVHVLETSGLQRTDVGTAGEDEIDRDDLAGNDVVEKTQLLTGVRGQFVVGKIVRSPDLAVGARRAGQQAGEQTQQQQSAPGAGCRAPMVSIYR